MPGVRTKRGSMTLSPASPPTDSAVESASRFVGPSGPPHHRLTLEAAAAYATHVDAARVRAATEGRTLVYTVRWI